MKQWYQRRVLAVRVLPTENYTIVTTSTTVVEASCGDVDSGLMVGAPAIVLWLGSSHMAADLLEPINIGVVAAGGYVAPNISNSTNQTIAELGPFSVGLLLNSSGANSSLPGTRYRFSSNNRSYARARITISAEALIRQPIAGELVFPTIQCTNGVSMKSIVPGAGITRDDAPPEPITPLDFPDLVWVPAQTLWHGPPSGDVTLLWNFFDSGTSEYRAAAPCKHAAAP